MLSRRAAGANDPESYDPPVHYVALVRGINVGGKAMVDMRTLKRVFEDLGYDDVATYINSGNVLFSTNRRRAVTGLSADIERAVEHELGFPVAVLVKAAAQLHAIADAVPPSWVNDASMKCDVLFLFPDVDRPSVLDEIPKKPEIEDWRYVPGAAVHRIDKAVAAKSPVTKLVGTALYQRLTIRNINTVRKLCALLRDKDKRA